MGLQIRVPRSKLLEAQLSAAHDENTAQRRTIENLQAQIQAQVTEQPEQYNVKQLCVMLADQEACTADAASLLAIGAEGTSLYERAKCEGKLKLHCKAQELQQYLHKSSNACQSHLVYLIWQCQVEGSDEHMQALIEDIRCELAECPDMPVRLRKHYNTILAAFE